MAILDAENDHIVIRLVYDGSPLSGKTTSLRALSSSLSRTLYTPEEREGRTLFFDWMEYTGGSFEGYRIRCQLVSVPGQAALAPRRQRILEGADAVVFVGDTSRSGIDESLACLKNLVHLLREIPAPPVGIIFQANKRDVSDAVSLEEIKIRLAKDGQRISVIESIASEWVGVRQAFVFAVRLSLDRVREQMMTNSLPHRRPQVDSGEDLLHLLKAAEEYPLTLPNLLQPDESLTALSNPPVVASQVLHDVLMAEEQHSHGDDLFPDRPQIEDDRSSPPAWPTNSETEKLVIPNLPTANAPTGMMWPPVEGRITLHTATAQSGTPVRLANGDWAVTVNGQWQFHSYQTAVYADLRQARQQLLQWAHVHLAVLPMLSPQRCLALAESADGHWRLWQVIKVEKPLREALMDRLTGDWQGLADGVWGTVYLYFSGLERLKELPVLTPCLLDSLSCVDWELFFNRLMPNPAAEASSNREPIGEGLEMLKTELREILAPVLSLHSQPITDWMPYLQKRSDGSPYAQQTLDLIGELLADLKRPESK